MSNDSRRSRRDEQDAERDIIIGRVKSVNVLRRTLRIASATSHPERFSTLRELHLKTRSGQQVCFSLQEVRETRAAIIATVEAKSDDEIASVRGATVVVAQANRFEVPEDEYYVDDLIGLVVRDREGAVIGRLSEVWETPANDIYRVLDEKGREVLLPAIEDVILSVDIERGELTADISTLM